MLWFLIGFIDSLQVVTTNNYYIILIFTLQITQN
jgi:hypothetical protein